jgi:hypothetical protein
VRRAREVRVIATAVRCYPASWRHRHSDEATALASALLEDGTPWWSIVGSFVGGATKERLLRTPKMRIGTAITAIILVIAAAPLALFASLTPASASGTRITIVISNNRDAVRQLSSALKADAFNIAVVGTPVSSDRVGSILSIKTSSQSGSVGAITLVRGRCTDGSSGCVIGLALPSHYDESAQVAVGVPMTFQDTRSAHRVQHAMGS